jgi:UDP-2-acetamido-3-amino-2,3-dideoxy-glucuronate N-acetyltransferase
LGKIRKEENALWSFAPHDISVILSLAGHQLPEQVHCFGGSYLSEQVADTTLTTLRFAGGLRAHIYVSWLNPFKEQKLTVVGSKGMAVFDDTRSWGEKLILHRDYLTWTNGNTPTPNKAPGEKVQVEESEPLRNECQHFLDCCRERRAPRTDGYEGLRVLQVLQMAQASLESEEGVPRATHTVQIGKDRLKREASERDFFAHESAFVDEGAVVGKGTKIWHFSHVMPGAEIGQNCNLGQNVVISGGVKLGNNVKVQNNVSIYTGVECEDDVFLGPSCVLTNVTNPRSQIVRQSLYEKTVIRRGATVGANATIVCGITLGRYSFISAGAVVTKNVPDYALMMGVPARQKGWISRHGHILVKDDNGKIVCPESGLKYQEDSSEVLRCIDLDEEAPLPKEMAIGRDFYDAYKLGVGGGQ